MAEIATTCPFCSCGCGLYLHVQENRITGVAPSRTHPVSQGRLCLKGWHAHELTDNPARLTTPLVRGPEGLRAASWEEALAEVAWGLRARMAEGGSESIGVLGSARCTNEDNYVLARFARAVLGTPHLDFSLRTGDPLGDGKFADLERADLIVLLGNDPNEEHPAAAARIYRARQRGAHLLVIGTRRHALSRLADVFVPVQPGAEATALAAVVEAMTGPEEAERHEETVHAATLLSQAPHTAVLYSDLSRGPSLAPVLDQLDAAAQAAGHSVSVCSLPPRSNFRGALDMGVRPDALPGRAALNDDAAASRLAHVWGADFSRDQGLSAWQMLEKVDALYVMGCDPLRAAGDPKEIEARLSGLKFLVVQDLFLSPTAELAHVVLPAAAFAERDGTFTNLEGRVQRLRAAVAPPGRAREDWRIVAEVSRALGAPLPYRTSEDVFGVIASHVPAYRGLSYATLGTVPSPARAVAATVASTNGAAKTSAEYPLLLVPDPTFGPWDGETTITGTLTVGVEFSITGRDYPDGMLCLHPDDAKQLGLRAGRNAQVTSARGACTMKVMVTEEAPQGIALVPYWQAPRLGVLQVAPCPVTQRPLLEATPVAIASV